MCWSFVTAVVSLVSSACDPVLPEVPMAAQLTPPSYEVPADLGLTPLPEALTAPLPGENSEIVLVEDNSNEPTAEQLLIMDKITLACQLFNQSSREASCIIQLKGAEDWEAWDLVLLDYTQSVTLEMVGYDRVYYFPNWAKFYVE